MIRELIKYIKFPIQYHEPTVLALENDNNTNDIQTGAIICGPEEIGVELFPIINGILVLLPPERIVSSEERKAINNLLAQIKKSNSKYTFACERYSERMLMDNKDTKYLEFDFYEKKYQNLWHTISNGYIRYGDQWYNAVRDVLGPMRTAVNPGAKILEIAGGDFSTFPSVYPPQKFEYFFVGTEISYWGLLCGKKMIPHGQFIQVDSDQLQFAPASFDAIFIKGGLHHQTQQQEALPRIISYLKQGGLLGFIETVRDGRKPTGFSRWAKAIIEPKKMTSPMNESIDKHKTLSYLHTAGIMLSLKERMSIVRYILAKALARKKTKSLVVSKVIVWVDDIINSIPFIKSRWLTSTHLLSAVLKKQT